MITRDQSLLRQFDINPNAVYWGEVHQRFSVRIRDAVESRRMLGVVGRFGSGKSMLVREALADMDRLDMVYVNNPDKEKLRIGHIVSAIVSGLAANESPRRDLVARATQVARIMGERAINQGREVCVVIENAHRMHANTLMALKDLRESAIYRGYSPLFSVVLVGQEALGGKLDAYGEVKYRSKQIDLTEKNGWMTHTERVRYLAAIYGEVIAPKMRNRLAALHRSPLELDFYVEEKLEMMRDAGIDRMTLDQVDLSIREQREALRVSLRELEEVSGVPKSTISDVEHGKNQDPETRRQIMSGIDRLVQDRSKTNHQLKEVA